MTSKDGLSQERKNMIVPDDMLVNILRGNVTLISWEPTHQYLFHQFDKYKSYTKDATKQLPAPQAHLIQLLLESTTKENHNNSLPKKLK